MNEADDMKRRGEEVRSLTHEELLLKFEELERQNKELKEHLSSVKDKESVSVSPQYTNKKTQQKLKKTQTGLIAKKSKKFDFSRYNTRHIALKIAYLGWDYHGFASQENIENTIEAHLFNALLKACLIEERSTCNYSRCGRTDKGVSAFAQVISLEVRTNLDESDGVIQRKDKTITENSPSKNILPEEIEYVHLLNKLLPAEIQVLAWTPVPSDFKARFSCVHRKYKYYFPAGDMDIERMDQAGRRFIGEHDFRNFCKMDVGNNVTSFYRNVVSVEVQRIDNPSEQREYDMCVMTVCGMAFLWHQVRCMVSILFLIGQHLEEPEIIDHMLDIKKCPQRPQYNMASEGPLVLFDCEYNDLEWRYHPDHLKIVSGCFQRLWTTNCIQTTMIKDMLSGLDQATVSNKNQGFGESSHVSWADSKDKTEYPGMCLIPGHHVKSYKKILTRALCDSLETKLENLSAKRKRLKTEQAEESQS